MAAMFGPDMNIFPPKFDENFPVSCKGCSLHISSDKYLILVIKPTELELEAGVKTKGIFTKIENCVQGDREEKSYTITGHLYMRRLYCKGCNECIGWFVEHSFCKYVKPGKAVLLMEKLSMQNFE